MDNPRKSGNTENSTLQRQEIRQIAYQLFLY
ncbi:hypothetical protein M2408_005049 [Sphingobacterium sp. BIGb0165]|nr:hypothetical protein [Sphingobacterium sp. BIGb0165]